MRLRQLILPLILLAVAVKLAQLGATRHGVGPLEYVTLAAVVAFLLYSAIRLARRAVERA